MDLKTAFGSKTLDPFYTGGPASVCKDGRYLATCMGADVVVTDLLYNRQLVRVPGDDEDDRITAMVLLPDHSYLVMCTINMRMRIVRLEVVNESESENQTEMQWSYSVSKTIARAHDAPVVVMTTDSSSTLVATGGAEGAVKVWDVTGGFCTHNFRGHGGVVSALQMFGSGPNTGWTLASGSEDNTVRVWDLIKKKCVHVLDSHVSVVRGLDFSADGRLLVSGGRDRVVNLWKVHTGQLVKTMPVRESIEAVGFLNSADVVYTGGEQGAVKLWSLASGEMMAQQANVRLADSAEEVGVAAVLRTIEGKNNTDPKIKTRLYSVLTDATIVELDNDLHVHRRIGGDHGAIVGASFVDRGDGRSGRTLALATSSPEVRLVDLDDALTFDVLVGHTEPVVALARSVRGQFLASAAKDSQVRVWHVGRRECVTVLKGHVGAVGAIGLPSSSKTESGDNDKSDESLPRFAVTGAADQTVKKWDLKTGQALYTRKAHDGDINGLAVSSDDRFFATASQDRTARVWDLERGEVVGILRGHRRGVWSAQFSRHDRTAVCTASADGTVKLWSLRDFSCVRTFEGHAGAVYSAVWLSQGLQIASSGGDGLVRVWEARTGECSCVLDNHEDRVWAVVSRDDDRGLVSVGGDSRITEWTDETAERAAGAAARAALEVETAQELENCMRQGQWAAAVALALKLDQPLRLYRVLSQLVSQADSRQTELGLVVESLDEDQLLSLLRRVRDWNTTARTASVAHEVLHVVLRQKSYAELAGRKGVKKIVDAMLPHAERQYARVDELLRTTYALDYITGM